MWLLRSSSVPRKIILAALAGLAVLVGLGLALRYFPSQDPSFENVPQFAAFARQHGLYVRSSSEHKPEDIGFNCYATDHPLEMDQLQNLSTAQCGLTPAWKGVVWASVVHCEEFSEFGDFGLQLDTLDGHWRLWGNIVVAGDPELLARLEQWYQARK